MKRALLLVACLAVVPAAFAGGRLMKEGQWEITMQMEMEGMPANIPPRTITKCIKPEDVKKPEDILKNSHNSEDCTAKDVKLDGNHLTWSMECHKRGGTQTGQGDITYAGESYEGTVTVQMNDPRMGNRKMVQHMKGRRTGDCP
jgi:hypothetical protein